MYTLDELLLKCIYTVREGVANVSTEIDVKISARCVNGWYQTNHDMKFSCQALERIGCYLQLVCNTVFQSD